MPRRSKAEALQTRASIVDRAVQTASVEGLEGVTIGQLADDLSLSKAGVIGHFGSKADLQLATLRRAQAMFLAEVWEPCADKTPGIERLRAVSEAWLAHITNSPFAGGCFMTQVATEWDARAGDLREEISDGWGRWQKTLRNDARTAIEAGDLPADADPEQIAFELNAIAMGLNQAIQLFGDTRATARARRAARRILG